jgi:TP901 family phage tail tape measure protein
MAGDRKLKVEILGDGTGAERALGDVARSGESSGGRLSSALSSAMGQLGLPFTGAVDNFGKHLDSAGGKSQSFGEKVGGAARGISLGMAAAVGAVGAESVHLALNFDQATGKIAASAGISNAAAKSIGDAFLSTAGSTTFSAQEIATSYAGVAGQFGAVEGHALTAKQALGVMTASIDLAEGSGTSLDVATASLAATMQAYGLKAADAGLATDVLFNTSRATGVGIDTVTGTFQKLHSTLGAVTPDLGQVGGIMVDLAQHGETGKKALSAVNTALNGLLAPSKSAADAQKFLGLSVYDANGKFVGFGSLMDQLKPKLAGMTQEQQLATLKAVGFGTANKALLTTILDGPGAFDKATAAASRQGTAHDAAGKATGNLKAQGEKLKSGLEDLGVRIGEALIPKLVALEHGVLSVVQWFEKHKGAAQALAITVGTVLAGALLIYVTNLAIAGAKSTLEFGKMIAKGALWVVEATAQPVMVAASNVASAAAAAAAWIAANAAMLLATAGIGLAIAAIVVVAVLVFKHWHQIVHAIAEAWDWVRAEAIRIWGMIEGFFKKWWPVILVIMTGGVALIPILLIKYWHQISADVSDAWNAIISFFTGIPGKIIDALSSLGSMLAGAATTAWNAFSSAVVSAWEAEVSFFTGLPGKILDALGDAAQWLLKSGGDLVQGLVNGISAAWSKVWDFIKGKLTGLVGQVMSFFGISSPSKMFHGFGVNLMEGLAMGINAGSGSASDAMTRASAALAGFSVQTGSTGTSTTGQAGSSPSGTFVTPSATSTPAAASITINGYDLSDPHKTAAEIAWNMHTAPV